MVSTPVHHLPTVRQLRYFVALARLEHFGRAAEACNVSQSAFSNAIQEFERLLGTRLVDRTRRSVTVTARGREVAAQARVCLQNLETLTDIARAGDQPLTGTLRLGVIPTIGPFLLPGALGKIRKKYPRLQLFLREDQTERLVSELRQGELDAIVIALPYPLKSMDTRVLFRDRFLLAFRKGTRLLDPDNYQLSNLPQGSVLLLEDGHCLRDHALAACRIRNLDKVHRFGASSLQTLVEMVEADLGVTYLPEMALGSALLRGTRIDTRPLATGAAREIAMVWRQGSGRVEDFQRLAEMLIRQ